MNEPAASLLELRSVSVRFGGLVALDKVDLCVPPDQVIGVIGPNGAGKTTLFNVVCGFVRPDEGRIDWRGQTLIKHSPHHLVDVGIARTLQGLGLFAELTALENVMVGATRKARASTLWALLGLPWSDSDEAALRARAMAELDALGAADIADRLPGQLSYGMQKRVALARALVCEPSLLLLDEPAAGLSDTEMRDLAELISQLRSKMSVVLVEHHMDFVMGVCDQVVVLDFGKVIATGSPAEVAANPLVIEAYLGDEVPDTAAATAGPHGEAEGA